MSTQHRRAFFLLEAMIAGGILVLLFLTLFTLASRQYAARLFLFAQPVRTGSVITLHPVSQKALPFLLPSLHIVSARVGNAVSYYDEAVTSIHHS
jgi:hypothetical protein